MTNLDWSPFLVDFFETKVELTALKLEIHGGLVISPNETKHLFGKKWQSIFVGTAVVSIKLETETPSLFHPKPRHPKLRIVRIQSNLALKESPEFAGAYIEHGDNFVG